MKLFARIMTVAALQMLLVSGSQDAAGAMVRQMPVAKQLQTERVMTILPGGRPKGNLPLGLMRHGVPQKPGRLQKHLAQRDLTDDVTSANFDEDVGRSDPATAVRLQKHLEQRDLTDNVLAASTVDDAAAVRLQKHLEQRDLTDNVLAANTDETQKGHHGHVARGPPLLTSAVPMRMSRVLQRKGAVGVSVLIVAVLIVILAINVADCMMCQACAARCVKRNKEVFKEQSVTDVTLDEVRRQAASLAHPAPNNF